MYAYLRGRAVSAQPAALILDVAGVGFELTVPFGFGIEPDAEVTVWTHLIVRENDTPQLFGFRDSETRELFRTLLRVRGVGPSLAMTLLSSLSASDLLEAIANENVARLTAVKGVGRKTAEQILLDLRDTAPALLLQHGGTPPTGTQAAAPAGSSLVEDAVAALISIGFSEKDARKNVERVTKDAEPNDLEALLRAALRK